MKTSHFIGALLVLASAAGCEREAPTAPRMAANTATGNADGRIAFANHEIFVMGEDGSGVTQLTQPAISHDDDPVWSPDGTRIAFRSTRESPYYDIYVMNADGTGVTQLTNAPGSDITPTWAPACDRLAFVTNRDGNYEIYVMNPDGTGVTRLTTNTAVDQDPAWSPDGSRIAFASSRDGNSEIYVMNADGMGATRLTNDPGRDGTPAWSPDGSR